MKNLSKLSLLVVFLSIFIYTPVFAATVPTSKAVSVEAVLIASVDIKDAKIVSQKGNIFDISFSFFNRGGLQTDVKYGVKLVSESKTGQLTVDEKVYDESLTLNSNMTTKKDITYTAPTSLSGSYTLMLISNNSSGFPFESINLGKVTLTATTKGIEILPESCTLQIIGDKTNKTYSLAQGVGINSGESISLTCEALNSSKVDVIATPSYEVHLGTSFGDILSQSGGSVEPITFKAGEKQSFSVSLPKATTPQIYNVNFTLNDKTNKSNSIDVNYIVFGVSATIENVSLDKDYYNKGDTALLSLVYKSNSPSSITSKIQISNSKGKSCAEPQTQTLIKPIAPKVDTSIAITSTCIDPKISVTLTDDKGVVLAQKEFNVKTTSATPAQASNKIIIYVIISLLVIIILYIYLKRKKNLSPTAPTTNSIPMNIIFPFLLLVALFGFMPTNVAKASSTYKMTSADGNVDGTFTLDKAHYLPGESLNASGGFLVLEGWGYSTTNILLEQYLLSQYKSSFTAVGYSINNYNISNTFTAPSSSGLSSIAFYISYTNSFGISRSYHFDIPFGVDAPPAVPLTVTVSATNVPLGLKSAGSLTVPYNTSVHISWTSSGATHCYCTYAGTKGDCGEGFGTDVPGKTLTLVQSKTFTVQCDDNNISFCPTDTQTCPDGTTVGRINYPTCDFKPCRTSMY